MTHIYNIPAGIPFAKALAKNLLDEYQNAPEDLAGILILLPTRRACRTLREAFLQLNAGKPILLPRMQALGDIDEEELSLSIAGATKNGGGTQELLNLPPSLPPMRRQILLARAIHAKDDFPHSFDQALTLAKDLGHLMDQIYTENLDIKDLASLVPEDFATHWQITLDFLKILSEEWPKILESLGVIDIAERRNALIIALSNFWNAHPPQTRIIAAGTTGSIPATAELLKTIAALPNGQIILPGLDENIDDDSWNALAESHPQFGFKHLFEHLGIDRYTVKPWPTNLDKEICENRRMLCHEIMRPAGTTKQWQTLGDTPHIKDKLNAALQHFKSYSCETQDEEATTIALLMRQILEEPTKTAALITPDRILAKRVAMACRRWGITIDDSAGTPLSQSAIGQFLILVTQACETNLAPTTLLSLLKHPFFSVETITRKTISKFEEHLLRGIKPPPGFDGLRLRLKSFEDKTEKPAPDLTALIETLEERLSPLLSLYNAAEDLRFKTMLETHIKTCEALSDPEILWKDESGQSAAIFMGDLFEHSSLFPDIYTNSYTPIVQQFLSAQTLRPAYGTHPRLQILGQLEARLIDADLVILGGLNESTWPPDPGHDPWMSRPMRKEFGLPVAERSIGLAAHDFVQGLCAPTVAITHAARIDGAPTVPARWLQRLDTVLEATGLGTENLRGAELEHWRAALDRAQEATPIERPRPTPPIENRPQKLPITAIETWLKDPYSVYARYILKLKTLDPLEKDADAALRGQILHDVLDTFITTHPESIPQNAATILHDISLQTLPAYNLDAEDWEFYWPRFERIVDSFLSKEHEWRETAKPLKTEITGEMTLPTTAGDFTLYGRADRIDHLPQRSAAIIDYKSGGQFSKSGMENGDLPQLPLEALILQHGGFEDTPAAPCAYLGYWVLNGNDKHTEISGPKDNVEDIIEDTKTALTHLIETFANDAVPYLSLPRPDKTPRFNDYEHLARVKEWAALDEAEDAA